MPLAEQGVKVLGTPMGHDEYVRSLLEKIQAKQQFLLNAIPTVPDVQSAWLLLLHCASARVNYQLRVVRQELVNSFAESHDQGLWRCLCAILGVPAETCDGLTRATATLPLSLGGLGLRSAARTRESAYWASWADSLSMVQARHPSVAELMVYHLEGESLSPSLRAASQAATELDGIEGFILPQWSNLAAGFRPENREPEDHEPGSTRDGWQHGASSGVEQHFRATRLFPHMNPAERALVRSQSGPGAGVPFLTSPTSPLTRIESPLFRVLLQRRLRLPLPLSKRMCGCGHSIDSFGHHRAACSRTGVLGRRGFAVESAAARVCREAGGRVATNMFVRNMDLGVPRAADSRRLEVVVDGLPLFGGVQLAVDTTLVSALKGDGVPRRGAADRDGVALAEARRTKERTYPELVGPWFPGSSCGLGSGGGRQVFRRSQDLRPSVGQGPRQVGTATHTAPS